MDVILVPGFWLDASSWSAVTPPLEAAGHRVRPLTLPGLESVTADRAGIGLRDHVDAVVAEIDAGTEPVVLVGHSGGGAIISAAIDARPDRVVRAVYVDSGPLADGACINEELPSSGSDIPLPDWTVFDAEDLVDLDDELREQFRARAVPQPKGVAVDRQQLSEDDRRLSVPATVVACEFSSEMLRGLMEQGHPYVAELARLQDVEFVDLPTGHWPQFTKPAELGAILLRAVDRT